MMIAATAPIIESLPSINFPWLLMHDDTLDAHARQWPEISTDDNILHRNKVGNIPHRCRDYNILHRNRVDNIPHSNMDIHSTHAYRLDDRPVERADGRVHNSTVHNLVELVWSPSSHSTVLRSWMGTLSQRRQR